MKKNVFYRIVYIIGILAVLIGAIDPLEGSLVIVGGSLLLSILVYGRKDAFKKLFLLSTILIIIGVAIMFFLSSLGGFGGTSELSWAWGLFILPYPVGWLLTVVLLIIQAIRSIKNKRSS